VLDSFSSFYGSRLLASSPPRPTPTYAIPHKPRSLKSYRARADNDTLTLFMTYGSGVAAEFIRRPSDGVILCLAGGVL
jgi:hypothetical protein